MSEELDQILQALPIFPLAVVLFPGEVLPLHIFEDRYKKMMKHAIEHGRLFGLCYQPNAAINRDTPPDVGSIGCVAKINAVMPLDEGKMNVVSTGLVRYRISGVAQRQPFVLARVESLTDDVEPEDEFRPLIDDVVETSKRFLETARALDELGPVPDELPDDAESLSLLMSSVVPLDSNVKQLLLEMTSTRLRLTRLRHYLLAAVSSFDRRLEIRERARKNGQGNPAKTPTPSE